MRGREGGQPLGQQVVAGEARPNLDEVAGLAEVGDGLGQEDGDVAVLGPQRMVPAALDARLAGRAGHGLLGPGRVARLALRSSRLSMPWSWTLAALVCDDLGHESGSLSLDTVSSV